MIESNLLLYIKKSIIFLCPLPLSIEEIKCLILSLFSMPFSCQTILTGVGGGGVDWGVGVGGR